MVYNLAQLEALTLPVPVALAEEELEVTWAELVDVVFTLLLADVVFTLLLLDVVLTEEELLLLVT